MRGFTLIEALIYMALFAIVLTGIVVTAYGYFETLGRNQTKAMLQEEAGFILDSIGLALSSAQTVSVPAAGGTGPALSVVKYGGGTAQVCFSGSSVRSLAGAGSCTTSGALLNNTNITVTSLTFVHTYPGGLSPESVGATLVVSAPSPQGGTVTETVSATSFIRK